MRSDRNTAACVRVQLDAARQLRETVDTLRFGAPVVRVYNPLSYAWDAFAAYVERYGAAPKRALFLGMNPGPWGMAQTGVPFGEVEAVRDWMRIEVPTGRPADEHPQYPVEGLSCRRSEVSGRRLWGLFRERFGTPEAFFSEHLVVNYCPLLFIAASPRKGGAEGGRNLTPDKLSADERQTLYAACGAHLRAVVTALRPRFLVGIGGFAEARAREDLTGMDLEIVRILHPSPASPLSNRDWPGTAARQLVEAGVWKA